jgi:hypothetical protein
MVSSITSCVRGLEQAGSQGLTALPELGRLQRGERHIKQDQVHGDRVKRI